MPHTPTLAYLRIVQLVLLSFANDVSASSCAWWDPGIGKSTPYDCARLTLRGIAGSDLSKATERAEACARSAGEVCILSHEVDYPLPAVFVWDASKSRMRPLLFPRVEPLDVNQSVTEARVRVQHPLERRAEVHDVAQEWIFRTKVNITYIDGIHSWHPLSNDRRELEYTDAFCVQLLRQSLSDSCLRVLDDE